MKLEVQFSNLASVLSRLDGVRDDIAKAAGRALYSEAELVMTAAKQLTPVDTGTLRASGHVQPPEVASQSVSVELGFGGAASEYAEIVHQDLNANHTVGQAKFLEEPLMDAQPRIQQAIDDAIRDAVRSSGFDI